MDKPERRDIRLHGYDYSRNGAYFVTVCTQNKMCIFWENEQKYQPLAGCADNECLTEPKITNNDANSPLSQIISNSAFPQNFLQSQLFHGIIDNKTI